MFSFSYIQMLNLKYIDIYISYSEANLRFPTLLSLTGVAPKSRGKDVSTGSLGHLRRKKNLHG